MPPAQGEAVPPSRTRLEAGASVVYSFSGCQVAGRSPGSDLSRVGGNHYCMIFPWDGFRRARNSNRVPIMSVAGNPLLWWTRRKAKARQRPLEYDSDRKRAGEILW
jgi:hypothetical protein